MALCVSLCPPEELKTYQDLKRFAMLNGEGGQRGGSGASCCCLCDIIRLMLIGGGG